MTTPPEFLFDGPDDASQTVVLAHGAGAPMDSEFMNVFAEGIAEAGYRVARFEFPYMIKRRQDGTKRPPDRQPVLLETWVAACKALGGGKNLVIGGKSMGGRMASLIADKVDARGLVCLGYPFHSPGKPESPRIEHLCAFKTPTLIVQGTRDALGSRDQVVGYRLSTAVRFHWLQDGDHGFKPRKASGLTESENLHSGVAAVVAFLNGL